MQVITFKLQTPQSLRVVFAIPVIIKVMANIYLTEIIKLSGLVPNITLTGLRKL